MHVICNAADAMREFPQIRCGTPIAVEAVCPPGIDVDIRKANTFQILRHTISLGLNLGFTYSPPKRTPTAPTQEGCLTYAIRGCICVDTMQLEGANEDKQRGKNDQNGHKHGFLHTIPPCFLSRNHCVTRNLVSLL